MELTWCREMYFSAFYFLYVRKSEFLLRSAYFLSEITMLIIRQRGPFPTQ